MLKPKYVHGLNAENAPQTLLPRLQNSGIQSWFDDIISPDDNRGDDDVDTTFQWTWTLG